MKSLMLLTNLFNWTELQSHERTLQTKTQFCFPKGLYQWLQVFSVHHLGLKSFTTSRASVTVTHANVLHIIMSRDCKQSLLLIS